ncbi:MAG: RDD family protein [Steroidobacteraceae bacterium]
MSEQQLRVQSLTGVDLTLKIAGPGTRSYAFVIDWHIRLLLACVWLLVAAVAQVKITWRTHDGLISVLPAAIIYFLYHPVVEVMTRGQTPGKRMAGVRILGRDGGQPSTTALLLRNVFRLIDSLPATYLVGLTTCFLTRQRVRLGDIAAGTLLVLDNAAAEASLLRIELLAANSKLSLDALELIDQVLERWDSLESANRARVARSLLSRLDPKEDAANLAHLSDAKLRDMLQAHLGSDAAVNHV